MVADEAAGSLDSDLMSSVDPAHFEINRATGFTFPLGRDGGLRTPDCRVSEQGLPGWVLRGFELDAMGAPDVEDIEAGILVDAVSRERTARVVGVRVRADREGSIDGEHPLTLAGRRAYTTLRDAFAGSVDNAWRPVRFWNYIPDLLAPAWPGTNRYMAFNIGRHEVLGPWLASHGMLGGVAASGVGHLASDTLDVYALAMTRPGQSVENPRQIPASRYSVRYGPKPPLFARATWAQDAILGPAPCLLISGTAGIIGEDSQCIDNPEGQLEETIRNLGALIDVKSGDLTIDHIRIYGADRELNGYVAGRLSEHFGAIDDIEITVTDLCRPDLWFEVEGVARGPAQDPHAAR